MIDFLDMSKEDQDTFVINTVHRVIEERKVILSSLKENPKNRIAVAAYLAANMMTAIKHDTGSNAPKTDIITQGLIETKNKKVSSHPLKAEDDERLTLKEIAQNRSRR